MDTVTHALLGTAIAEAGFRSKLGKRALIAGAIYGSLPDADMFLVILDPKHMLNYHRAASHSIILAFIAAPLLGWLAWKFGKKTGSILIWSFLALLAVLSHDLLDLFTSWGTEIFYPFSNTRFAISALPIVDPLITLPLIGVLVSTIILKNLKIRRIAAALALLWCISYTAMGYNFSNQAIKLLSKLKPAGFEVIQAQAAANPGTILLWHVALRDKDNNFFIGDVKSLKNEVFNTKQFTSIHDKRLNSILNATEFEIHRRTSRDMLLIEKNEKENNIIVFRDMRYAILNNQGNSIPLFWTEVLLSPKGEIKDIKRQRANTKDVASIRQYLDKIFN